MTWTKRTEIGLGDFPAITKKIIDWTVELKKGLKRNFDNLRD
jgi:hypothetical protein